MGGDDEARPMSVAEVATLTKMLEEHRPRLEAMLRRRIDPALRARIDAEELVSDTFDLARRRWHRFAASGMSPYPWLYRLARDCLIEAWRRQTSARRDPARELPWPEQSSAQLGLSLVATGTTPSEALNRLEIQGRMQQALGALDPDDRDILWMRDFDQLPFRDVAEVLGIAENTAMKRHARAMRRLKDRWLDLFKQEGSGP